MYLRTEVLPKKILVGRRLNMTLAHNRTFELWSGFMPLRKTIADPVGSDLYSVQVFSEMPEGSSFGPDTRFEKWAAVEVKGEAVYGDGLETLCLNGGLYAVFLHKGLSSEFHLTMDFIFKEWLPISDYRLDHRPHFELLGSKYKNDHPESEEEVWIPVRPK
ncbi:AraC family transcriptional regulator [Zobellia uliginosa]|uniref:AraC family transcriptional regulator n=1 Tax=Zobellia uliginosa TaxID=143224 RepID=A0ABY1KY78_9FLAO|nr:GyrI-like domain-containing protein [Zobellia uliginosa]SIS85149.1 AraC family transcriptional regulator [Zobellia uliginosa]